jgi:hypothetical protein
MFLSLDHSGSKHDDGTQKVCSYLHFLKGKSIWDSRVDLKDGNFHARNQLHLDFRKSILQEIQISALRSLKVFICVLARLCLNHILADVSLARLAFRLCTCRDMKQQFIVKVSEVPFGVLK